MTEPMIAQNVAWSGNLFRSLNEGAVWGVPRSGLIFRRRGDALVLVDQMPHMDAMPMTAVQLTEYQETDYQDVKRHFEAAGITVRKEVSCVKQ